MNVRWDYCILQDMEIKSEMIEELDKEEQL
jgi:hypothetical protein